MFKALPALKLFSVLFTARLIVVCLPVFLASLIFCALFLIGSMLVFAFLTSLMNFVFCSLVRFVRPLSEVRSSVCLVANAFLTFFNWVFSVVISFSRTPTFSLSVTRLINVFLFALVRSVLFMNVRRFFFFPTTVFAFREALFWFASSLTLFAVNKPFLKFSTSLFPVSPMFNEET